MDKAGCSSLSKVASEDELKGDKTDFGDETVKNKELHGLHSDQNNSSDADDGLVSRAGDPVPSLSLGVIPVEVWKVILDHMVNSEDIHNVLLAFPELDKPFQSKKAFWLFGAVLPHLMTKHLATGKFKDVFNLRLVSKRWQAFVDSSLRSHVVLQQLPLPPNSEEGHQKLMPSDNHFNYLCPQDSKFGASIFRTSQQIDEILMSNHSSNPFPGKYVAVEVSDSNVDLALNLFEKFGEHVRNLEIKFNGGLHCHLHLCLTVLQCLSHVPNLRSLTFIGVLHTSADEETGLFFCKPQSKNLFPDLQNLEAFNWQVDFERDDDDRAPQLSLWITRVIQKYGRQDGIKKLGILSCLYWYVSSSFPNLTELHLIGEAEEMSGLEFLKYVLTNLANPLNLRKLCLIDLDWVYIGKYTNLLNLLREYKVESLVLKDVPMSAYEGGTLDEVAGGTSITSLYLTDNLRFRYDFFNWLPNLKFLTIDFTMEEIRDRRGPAIMPGVSLARKIRGFVLKACDTNVEIWGIVPFSIWEELPKLEIFRVRVTQKRVRASDREDLVWNLQFVRECGDKAIFSSKPDDESESDDTDNDEDW